jgi:hypothetical protein
MVWLMFFIQAYSIRKSPSIVAQAAYTASTFRQLPRGIAERAPQPLPNLSRFIKGHVAFFVPIRPHLTLGASPDVGESSLIGVGDKSPPILATLPTILAIVLAHAISTFKSLVARRNQTLFSSVWPQQ